MVITSRVGRKPVTLPSNVELKIVGSDVHLKGPKGTLNLTVHPAVEIKVEGSNLTIVPTTKPRYSRSGTGAHLNRSIAGTMRSTLQNSLNGVTVGFEKKLLLVGVGYRAQVKGTELLLSVGFSHPVVFKAPAGITIEAPTLTEILIKGADKQLVGHVASKIRAVRSPEPYKGKGIRYSDEKIELKETKKK